VLQQRLAVDVDVRAEVLDQVDLQRHAVLGLADQVGLLGAEADRDLAVAALSRGDLLPAQRYGEGAEVGAGVGQQHIGRHSRT
jgi:hypothetical protein